MATKPDQKIAEMLNSPTKGKEEARGLLTGLWRQILYDRQISGGLWSTLMTQYLNDPQNGVPSEGKKRSSDRNNLNKELSRQDITWNVLFKGIKLLGAVRIKLDLTMTYPSGREWTHTITKQIKSNNKGKPQHDSNQKQQ